MHRKFHVITREGSVSAYRNSRTNKPTNRLYAGALLLLFAIPLGFGCSSKSANTTTDKPHIEQDKVSAEASPGDDPSRGMRLVDAVTRICAPKGLVPVWVLVSAEGKTVANVGETPEGWVWQGEGPGGPRGNWVGDGNDPIKAIAGWIAPFRVLDGDNVNGILLKCDAKMKDKLFLIRTDFGAYSEKP
jgi:hypothetical protein